MMGIQFQNPYWLVLLVPWLVIGIWSLRRQRRATVLFSDLGLVAGLPRTPAARARRLLPALRLAGILLLVIALARPQHGKEEFRVATEGIAIAMCLDRSGSMRALDFQLEGKPVDRLTAVKRVFRDFVAGQGHRRGRPDDLIGLVDFGGFVACRCPLTLDHTALLEMLETVQIPEPIFDKSGRVLNQAILEEDIATAIGDAVVLAVERLKDVPAKSKVIVLLSDGKQTAGAIEPAEAAETARLHGIRIHTIGVGATGTAPVPEVDYSGKRQIRPQQVELDEETLKLLAARTGGRYFNAKDTEALKAVYAEIDRLEKTPAQGRRYTRYEELYPYVVLGGVGLVLLEILLASTRLRSLPQ